MESQLVERSVIEQFLAERQFGKITEYCELAIEQAPDEVTNYWYLGLALLLQQQEEEAQLTWMIPLLDAEPKQAKQWVAELQSILHTEAERQEAQASYKVAWLLRRHWQEFEPDDAENMLHTLRLALVAGVFSFEDDLLTDVVEILEQLDTKAQPHLLKLLLQITSMLLDRAAEHPATQTFLNACIPYLSDVLLSKQFVERVLQTVRQFFEIEEKYEIAIELGRICLRAVPDHLKVMLVLTEFLQAGSPESLLEGIALAKRCFVVATRLFDRLAATHTLLSLRMFSGDMDEESIKLVQRCKALLSEILQNQSCLQNQNLTGLRAERSGEALFLEDEPSSEELTRLLAVGAQFLYFADAPHLDRPFRNQIAQVAQTHLRLILPDDTERYQQRGQKLKRRPFHQQRLPKIGYLSGGLRKHSIGWLVRWLLKHHDRNRFEVHLYSPKHSNDFIRQGLIQDYGEKFHLVPSSVLEIANRIYDDEIDILVELDSLTSLGGCGVVALKPAPIQVHWLGFDASGIPAVDYFIADPYVLPEDADEYYSEKIWRLPHTCIAVDGFETECPSLHRDQLDIPGDAVVFLSSQTGMKRNTENVRLQLKIIREVPNSYFLIKSFKANPAFIETFFQELAEVEGVSGDRLRFLPDAPSEAAHRANLSIADVILDTYPYNGATTTLEALWMGVPIVTQVGQQFAARNSYTMLMNVGVTAGIAWSAEEYVEWGVRLGVDAKLRQRVVWQLRQSRHTSPLWNVQQFTHEMERAYEQMWIS